MDPANAASEQLGRVRLRPRQRQQDIAAKLVPSGYITSATATGMRSCSAWVGMASMRTDSK